MTTLIAGVLSLVWALLGVWGLASDNLVVAFGGSVLALVFLAYAWVLRSRVRRDAPPHG